MDFLMSGEAKARETIAALAAIGHESIPVKFNRDSGWLSLTWLSIPEDPRTAPAIAKTVHRVDPAAIRI